MHLRDRRVPGRPSGMQRRRELSDEPVIVLDLRSFFQLKSGANSTFCLETPGKRSHGLPLLDGSEIVDLVRIAAAGASPQSERAAPEIKSRVARDCVQSPEVEEARGFHARAGRGRPKVQRLPISTGNLSKTVSKIFRRVIDPRMIACVRTCQPQRPLPPASSAPGLCTYSGEYLRHK